MGLQLRMKRQADEIIPLLKASSYRCKGAPLYDAYGPDPRHKAILYKTGLAIVVRLSVSAPCLSLFAVAHCGSITGNSEVIRLTANAKEGSQPNSRPNAPAHIILFWSKLHRSLRMSWFSSGRRARKRR